MKKDSKYSKPFKTMFPKKTWYNKTEVELAELASKLGDHNADWVEHALEWAQRIANGETWQSICNEPDTANWFRLVKWKNGYYCKVIGGSREQNDDSPASNVCDRDYCEAFNYFLYTVPLVVSYED